MVQTGFPSEPGFLYPEYLLNRWGQDRILAVARSSLTLSTGRRHSPGASVWWNRVEPTIIRDVLFMARWPLGRS